MLLNNGASGCAKMPCHGFPIQEADYLAAFYITKSGQMLFVRLSLPAIGFYGFVGEVFFFCFLSALWPRSV